MGTRIQLLLVGRVLLGTFLGYLIGLERARRGKDAGDRTFALLALGSAGFTAISIDLFPDSADRVIQGVAAGVGFLGAGVIFQAKSGTRGLTTAAAIWVSAAIGVLAGAGAWLMAILITLAVILILESHQITFLRHLSYGDREVTGDDAE